MDGEELEFEFICSVPDSLVYLVCLCMAKEPQLTGCCSNNVCKICLNSSKAEEDCMRLIACPSWLTMRYSIVEIQLFVTGNNGNKKTAS